MAKINDTQTGNGYLFRASSSDICNYDCAFCHPNENEPVDILTNDEFATIFAAANGLFSLKALHLTGGEPLMRRDLAELVARCREIGGPELDLAITTNAALLDRHLDELVAAGLSRTNISLHTLDPGKYKEFTGKNVDVTKVEENARAARAAGLGVKLNMVAIRGFNDQEIVNSAGFAFEEGFLLRFLELGLYGPVKKWFGEDAFIPHDEILARVDAAFGPFHRDFTRRGNGPSKYYANPEGLVFGILDNQSDPYCCGCDRFRMTANGIIKACNFGKYEDMRAVVNEPDGLREAFLRLGALMSSRKQPYIGRRHHVCDYEFRWNHPEETPIALRKTAAGG